MNNQKISVSVIMGVYNSEKYITKSIESIINQNFESLELIIINDGSTDDSVKIINSYKKCDKRIVFISNKKNEGPAIARNKGLKVARGKYIAILDSDDIALSNRLKIQKEFLDRKPEIFLVGSAAIIINDSGKIIKSSNPIVGANNVKKELKKKNCIYHPSIMFRADPKYMYRTKFIYSHDYDFYLNLLTKGGKLDNTPEKLIKRRISSGSIGETKVLKQALFAEKAREFYLQRLKYGKDKYQGFNPKEIMNLSESELVNKKRYLKILINNSITRRNFAKINFYTRHYKNKFGNLNKYAILYYLTLLPSFLPNNIFKLGCFLKKIINR
jgi:glycosyltransferase involved in cell wall biosynthesis